MVILPTAKELKELQTMHLPFSVSIYAPLLESNAANNPNRIELKNLLREAEQALENAGLEAKRIKKTLRPAKQLLEEHGFWPPAHEAFALFMQEKLFKAYRLPGHAVDQLVYVGNDFNLEPLQKIIAQDQPYYVLALSHKHVNVFEGNHYHLKPLQLKDFPNDMMSALGIDELPNWRETHATAPAGNGKGSRASHGQYDVSHTDKVMLLEFFRRIDRHLRSILKNQQAPLVIAGVQYLLPIYRRANTYPHLLQGTITGNLEHANLEEIRRKAWRLVKKEALA